ncbi:glycosyltransferase family 4 protein [Variovorax sp. PAMC28562]|uniref:glycosyltransferase family 4 protein n=1 Tax=Variovorax sp. PAMC28562 TaxID=2762323 RepID=UPI00164DCF8C|nr:glycosyltransferase family 4 protein [Variovorax sp. PAMC28562]QNK75216.1 glycosyltransferase family 4 protein [Variovorax sp. PAMC28562]
MPESEIRRHARRLAKAFWWAATPWRIQERMQFLRARAAARVRADRLAPYVASERERAARRARGEAVPAPALLDLHDDDALAQVAGEAWAGLSWPPVAGAAVVDTWTAARFCIDLLRRCADLRERFPTALVGGSDNQFAAWLQREGASEFGLSDAGIQHVRDALDADLATRARQAFLTRESLHGVLPQGLTPAGSHALFGWFASLGIDEAGLRAEEVWWLLLQAVQRPAHELMQAYLFTPAWQDLHPDGLTVFGRDAFATWFAAEYGHSADRGDWTDASRWPAWQTPALQIRAAFWARPAWRAAHPEAFIDVPRALAFLGWLRWGADLPEAQRAWCDALDAELVASELAQPGVNVIGHFCYASGLRVSVESMVQGMGRVGVATSLRDVYTDVKDDPHHAEYSGMEAYDVTVIHTQPEPLFNQAYERANLLERTPRTYRIGYWYWEFDSVPDAWAHHASKVDEIWAATAFVAKGLRAKTQVPVRTLFPGVKLAPFEARSKAHFGLDEGRFTFLFTFHMMSVMERKNPLGLIRAFRSAFKADEPVSLVLKTSFGDRHPTQLQELHAAAAGASIKIVDEVMSPDAVLSLMHACDAYVSLHRSEGLGLTMAEAMLMGKPVIATRYSGNVDFMDDGNSLLVDYRLVKLGRDIPPYSADLEWAEPSEAHAAQLMRRVYEDPDRARALGQAATKSARERLSLDAAGRRFADRLAEIREARRTA